MGAIIGSIIQNLIEVAVFAVIAWAGIMGGKKFKESKMSGKNGTN